MNGRRSAARTGGMIAFRTATRSATSERAAEVVDRDAAGGARPQTMSDAAATSHETRRRTGRIFGRSGCQATGSACVLIRAASPSRRRARCRSESTFDLPLACALGPLLRLLLGALRLLVGDLHLRVRVRLADERLAARPAEDPDGEDDGEEDVPGGRDELLGGGVVDGHVAVGTLQQAASAAAFVACVMPTAPGVTETTFASEPEPVTHMIDSNVTGIANAARKIPITASLQSQERSDGRNARVR